MNQEEEIQYWKEKFRLLKLSMQTEQRKIQENEDRVNKFKMVPNIQKLIDYLDMIIEEDNKHYKSKKDLIHFVKWKVNQELGVNYYELGE
jgi:hypothetical protein